MSEIISGIHKYERLDALTQLPPSVADETAIAFIENFYLNFPATKGKNDQIDEKQFLSFNTTNTSEESIIPKRVPVHDIIDHIGVGRLLNEFDTVSSLEPISRITENVGQAFSQLSSYLKSISSIVEDWKNLKKKIDLKMYILNHHDKDKPMNSNVKSIWDEMTEDQILKLVKDEDRYVEALSIYESDRNGLSLKYDNRTVEEELLFQKLTRYDKANTVLLNNDRENLFLELRPKIERRHVFEFQIRLNMLEWTESWIDSILDKKDANPPEISKRILDENAELNNLFKDSPEYFDLIEDSPEHIELAAKNKEIYARLQKKVLKLLNRTAPSEAKRYILLKHIEKQSSLEQNLDLN
jgi:hypothetical protein